MDSHGTRAVGTVAAPLVPVGRDPTRRMVRNVLGFMRLRAGVLHCLSLRDVVQPGVSAPFWFPDSVLLCALLCTRPRGGGCCCWRCCPSACWSLCLPTHLRGSWWRCVPQRLRQGGARGACCCERFLADPIRLTSMRDLGILLPVRGGAGAAAQRLRRCGRAQRAGASVLAQLRAMVARRCAWPVSSSRPSFSIGCCGRRIRPRSARRESSKPARSASDC